MFHPRISCLCCIKICRLRYSLSNLIDFLKMCQGSLTWKSFKTFGICKYLAPFLTDNLDRDSDWCQIWLPIFIEICQQTIYLSKTNKILLTWYFSSHNHQLLNVKNFIFHALGDNFQIYSINNLYRTTWIDLLALFRWSECIKSY